MSSVYDVGLIKLNDAVIVLPMFAVLLLFTRSFSWARTLQALFVVLLTIGELALISFWSPVVPRIDSYSDALLVFPYWGRDFLALLISACISCPWPTHLRPTAD